MKLSRQKISVVLLSIILGTFSNFSYATLINRGNGMIYDDVLDITWQQNANLAASGKIFGVANIGTLNGSMNWNTANRWIVAMNGSNYLGYNDWRLPSIKPVNGKEFNFSQSFDGSTDSGFNITSPNSELAYMYYVNLENLGGYDINSVSNECQIAPAYSCFANTGMFDNIKTSFGFYWSGTKPDPRTEFVLGFITQIGDSTNGSASNTGYSWAVRDGDVSVVPLPISFLLFSTALIGLLGLKKKIPILK